MKTDIWQRKLLGRRKAFLCLKNQISQPKVQIRKLFAAKRSHAFEFQSLNYVFREKEFANQNLVNLNS